MDMIGIICSIIGAIVVILGGVWLIINRVTKSEIECRLLQIENTIKELPCKEHSIAISDQSRNIHELKNLTKENNDMLTELLKWTREMDKKIILNTNNSI
jgi:hypothetical protein